MPGALLEDHFGSSGVLFMGNPSDPLALGTVFRRKHCSSALLITR